MNTPCPALIEHIVNHVQECKQCQHTFLSLFDDYPILGLMMNKEQKATLKQYQEQIKKGTTP